MLGCMLAVVVGLIRPVRNQLFAPEGKLLMIQVRGCLCLHGRQQDLMALMHQSVLPARVKTELACC
jgi:hypothetical protein